MRRRPIALCALILLAPLPARAGGINLSWSECGIAGTMYRGFACNTNAGSHQMVASFDPEWNLDNVVGALGIIDLCMGGLPLAPWWQFVNPGSCRPNALTSTALYIGTSNHCADHWRGQAASSIMAYQVGYSGWDSARILVSVWMTQSADPVEAGTEYQAFTVNISNADTAGEGACGGCNLPVCIVLNEIQLESPAGRLVLTSPRESNYLHWQGYPLNCPFIVPTTNRTWGQVKSLYR